LVSISYIIEFNTESLSLYEQGYSVQEDATILDITTILLYNQVQKSELHINSKVNSNERSELLVVRKKVYGFEW